MIGDDDLPSRAGTPRPTNDDFQPSIFADKTTKDVDPSSEKQPDKIAESHDGPAAPLELPQDVQAKLRKLEKIESRYQGAFHS